MHKGYPPGVTRRFIRSIHHTFSCLFHQLLSFSLVSSQGLFVPASCSDMRFRWLGVVQQVYWKTPFSGLLVLKGTYQKSLTLTSSTAVPYSSCISRCTFVSKWKVDTAHFYPWEVFVRDCLCAALLCTPLVRVTWFHGYVLFAVCMRCLCVGGKFFFVIKSVSTFDPLSNSA